MEKMRLRVLLVTDRPADGAALQKTLAVNAEPLDTRLVGSLAEAKEILSEERFDAILLCHSLIGETPGALHFLARGIPIIVIAEESMKDQVSRLVNQDLYGYLLKDSGNCFLAALPTMTHNAIRHKRTEQSLRYLSHALACVGECVHVTDMNGGILYVNKAFAETYGYEAGEIIGSQDSLLWENEAEHGEVVAHARASFHGLWDEETYHRRKNGAQFPVSVSLSILKDERGRDTALVWVAHEMAKDQRLESVLAGLSCLDGLTNLPDRVRFEDVLEQEWRRAQRLGAPISLVILDPDHFKAYNDLYGHRAGDNCLKMMAREISKALKRPGDLASRFGGDEFALILPGTNQEMAWAFAEKLRAAVEALRLPHNGSTEEGILTVSLGAAATVPGSGAKPAELIAVAEEALRQAKEGGRNQVKSLVLRE